MLNSILLLTAVSEFCLFAWPASYRAKYFSYIYISRETSIQSINHLYKKVALCCAFCECLDSHSEKEGREIVYRIGLLFYLQPTTSDNYYSTIAA